MASRKSIPSRQASGIPIIITVMTLGPGQEDITLEGGTCPRPSHTPGLSPHRHPACPLTHPVPSLTRHPSDVGLYQIPTPGTFLIKPQLLVIRIVCLFLEMWKKLSGISNYLSNQLNSGRTITVRVLLSVRFAKVRENRIINRNIV